jgi:DNA-binding response OmpR family regulator
MRILIIDDDEIFCRLLVEILEASGIQAIWTTDGLNGYEMLTHADFEVCRINVGMNLCIEPPAASRGGQLRGAGEPS